MKIISLGSAIPVRFGTPRQRMAYALRRALSDFAEARDITVDCWKTEWQARRKVLRGDGFFGHALHRRAADDAGFLSWPAVDHVVPAAPDPADGIPPQDRLLSGWMNPARQDRIAGLIGRAAPDLVLITEPAFWGIGRALVPEGTAIAHLDNGCGPWARHMSTQIRQSDHNQWFAKLARHLAHNRQGVEGAAITALAPPGAPEQGLILPVEQEESPLFFSKSPNLVVPATGNAWLDRKILDCLQSFLERVASRGENGTKLVLIGFDKAAARALPEAEFHRDWTRLHTMIGIAKGMFLPFAPPWLLPFAEAALTVGTPVLMTASDMRRYGLQDRLGLHSATERDLPAALAQLALTPMATEGHSRAIAEHAKPGQDGMPGGKERLAQLLSGWTGRQVQARPSPAPLPQPRRAPVRGKPQVLYNPVTQMLLLQAEILGWGNLEEIRLFDAQGAELTRLAPNANQRKEASHVLEGGVVTPVEALGGLLRVEGYCDVERLFEFEIRAEDFRTVECGLATIEFNGNDIQGTFWASRRESDERWFIRIGPEKASVSAAVAHAIPSLGIDVLPFRVPGHPGQPGGIEAEISKTDAAGRRSALPPQKSFAVGSHHVRARNTTPELEALKDCHAGQRAWILGNGPSVRLDDLARIPQRDITFCFNRFYLSYDEHPLREDYVVSADTLMIEDFGQEMIDISTGRPLFCMKAAAVADLRGDFVLLTPGGATVPDFSFDPARYVSVGGSSVFVALQMAWHMGIREVVLYGMDYSFSAELTRDPRYPFPVSFDEGNHFIKSYRDAKPWCPPTWRDISAGFLNARIAFEMSGGRVVNATRGGRLETFERVDFDALCPA